MCEPDRRGAIGITSTSSYRVVNAKDGTSIVATGGYTAMPVS